VSFNMTKENSEKIRNKKIKEKLGLIEKKKDLKANNFEINNK
jgi:hypothetical protein